MPTDGERRQLQNLFDTRSQAWRDVGLMREISRAAVRRARVEALVFVPLFVGVVIVFHHRFSLFSCAPGAAGHSCRVNVDAPSRVVAVIALVIIGWGAARAVGRVAGPALFRRMDPATAGTVGFLIRLLAIFAAFVVALDIAGLDLRAIAVGGAFTAVIFGLAAQQTLGNLIAGTVLLSARPFRVGDRVRLSGGSVGGQLEGVVSSLGLLYTTFADGDDKVMVPNSVVLNLAVTPLREPDSVNLRARLRPDLSPAQLEKLIEETVSTPLRSPPQVTLEELDGDELVVQIEATPVRAADGSKLATEVLQVISQHTRQNGASGT